MKSEDSLLCKGVFPVLLLQVSSYTSAASVLHLSSAYVKGIKFCTSVLTCEYTPLQIFAP